MRRIQHEIIEALEVKPVIDPLEEIERRTQLLAGYLAHTGLRGYVLGISGGQDSLLTGILAQRAVEQSRMNGHDATFHALKLPYGVQADQADVELALETIQPDVIHTHNIKSAVDANVREFAANRGRELSDFHKGNVKARERMVVQYEYAGEEKALVLGTDHAAEAVVGFFTKQGDGACDLTPLTGLTKRQGRAMLRALQVPELFVTKVPTADLLDNNPGQADDDELGITSDERDDALEGREVEDTVADTIERYYYATMHKRALPLTPTEIATMLGRK